MDKSNQRYYSQLQRQEIAIAIAKRLEAGETILRLCSEFGITRMSLWNWMQEGIEIKTIIESAIERRRAKKAEKLAESPSASRPKGWREVKPRSISKSEAEANGMKVSCLRCGHQWRPRFFPVKKCVHPTCQTVYFAVDGRFSDSEKKTAFEKRLLKPKRAVNPASIGSGKRGRPRKVLNNEQSLKS